MINNRYVMYKITDKIVQKSSLKISQIKMYLNGIKQ